MSGPIVPPLEVSDVADGGSVTGRPITTIEVTDGTLTVLGRTATIDTSGSGGSPATPVDSVQFNSDPAGTFTGDAGFVVSTAGGGATTRADLGNLRLGLGVVAQTLDHDIPISAGAAGQITLSNNNDGGGTMGDMQVNIIAQTATDDPILHLYNTGYSPGGKLHLDGGSGDFIITSGATSKDLDLKVNGTGQVEVQNTTTDTVSVLSIMGNGTGDARLDMQNASKRVWVVCDENKKLKVQGGSGGDTFIFDVSSASGGITFPDSTVQTTAATGGVSFPLEATDGSAAAPSYTFASQTGTGLYYHSANKIGFATGGGLRMAIDANSHLTEITRILNGGGSYSLPAYSFDADPDTGMTWGGANQLGLITGGSARVVIGNDGAVDFRDSIIEIDGDVGDDGQVLTSTGSAVAWEDVPAGGATSLLPPWQPLPTETGDGKWTNGFPFVTNSAGSSMSLGSTINKASFYPFYVGANTKISDLMIKVASDSTDGSTPQVKVAIYTIATLADQIADDTVIGTPVAKVTGSDATFAVDNSVANERRIYSYGADVILEESTWYSVGIVGGQAFTDYPSIRRNSGVAMQYTGDVNYGGWTNTGDSDYDLPASYSAGDSNWATSSAFFYQPAIFWLSPDRQT